MKTLLLIITIFCSISVFGQSFTIDPPRYDTAYTHYLFNKNDAYYIYNSEELAEALLDLWIEYTKPECIIDTIKWNEYGGVIRYEFMKKDSSFYGFIKFLKTKK